MEKKEKKKEAYNPPTKRMKPSERAEQQLREECEKLGISHDPTQYTVPDKKDHPNPKPVRPKPPPKKKWSEILEQELIDSGFPSDPSLVKLYYQSSTKQATETKFSEVSTTPTNPLEDEDDFVVDPVNMTKKQKGKEKKPKPTSDLIETAKIEKEKYVEEVVQSEYPSNQKGKKGPRSAVFCAIGQVLPLGGQPLNQHLRKEIDRLSILTTKFLNVASRLALLDLLTQFEKGKPLPALDQEYYLDVLRAIDTELGSNSSSHQTRLTALFKEFPKELKESLTLSGNSLYQNRLARTLATMTKNSVVFRVWSIQRRKLREELRKKFSPKELDGPNLETLLDEIQILLKSPTTMSKCKDGNYGYVGEWDPINAVIQGERDALPQEIFNQKVPITRKGLARKWHFFFPYLINRLKQVESNQSKLEKKLKLPKEEQEQFPYIGVTKSFPILPVFTFTRKFVTFEPSTFAQLLPVDLRENPFSILHPPESINLKTCKIEMVHTNGVKIVFVRRLLGNFPASSEADDEDEQNLEQFVNLDNLEEQRKKEKNEEKNKEKIKLSQAAPGFYSIYEVDFREPLSSPLVGVDPGLGNIFTFFEKYGTQETHLDAHRKALAKFPAYILQPFGISSKSYHHHLGTNFYRCHLKAKLMKSGLHGVDLSGMTMKKSSSAAISKGLQVQGQFHKQLLGVYSSKSLAHSKFLLTQRKQKFFHLLKESLKIRFPNNPIVCFGSAAMKGKIKGNPAAPSKSTKEVFGKLFRCISTPEPLTSQKCSECGTQLYKQQHQLSKMMPPSPKSNRKQNHPSRNPNKLKKYKATIRSEAAPNLKSNFEKRKKSTNSKGKFEIHGTLVCKNKMAHQHELCWSRDVNASRNMFQVVDHSYKSKSYTRPPHLNPQKKNMKKK